ncbi:26_t:CDS:2, partial [Funneliformis geosporum]
MEDKAKRLNQSSASASASLYQSGSEEFKKEVRSLVRNIQIDEEFINLDKKEQETPQNLQQLQEELQGKTLIAFNSKFEQVQLAQAGFKKVILKTTTKQDYKTKLVEKYGKKFFNHPEIQKDPLFQEYGTNDTRLAKELYLALKDKVDWDLFMRLQTLQDRLVQWEQKGIPFPRSRLEKAQTTLEELRKKSWDKQVDIRTGTDKYLETTKTGIKFDRKAQEELLLRFPNDQVLQRAYDISKKTRVLQQIKKLIKYASLSSSQDMSSIFHPNYIMLCQSTGRFSAREPELHNFTTRPPKRLVGKEYLTLYNVRDLLLGSSSLEKNVFSIDFSNQEDRMRAYFTKEPSDIQAFLQGQDVLQPLADQLKISRDQA